MAFLADFNSIAGTVTDSFKNIWSTVHTQPVTIPAAVPPAAQGHAGTGVGSALAQAAAHTDTATIIEYVLLGAGAIVLIVALLMIGKKR